MLYPLSYERSTQHIRQSGHARCVLAAQASEHLSHITGGKTYELGEAE
jgi:hypothetical protein